MKEIIIKNKSLIIIFIFFSFLFYLLWNTGIHGDDYSEISNAQNMKSVSEFFQSILLCILKSIRLIIVFVKGYLFNFIEGG